MLRRLLCWLWGHQPATMTPPHPLLAVTLPGGMRVVGFNPCRRCGELARDRAWEGYRA